MKRNLVGIATIVLVMLSAVIALAQSPSPSPSGAVGVPVAPIPVDPSLPANRPPIPTTSPSPTVTPTAQPSVPAIPVSPTSPSLQPSLPAASTAPPLPINGTYRDPNGRYQIGILQDYKVSPIAGAVLIEAGDGNLAYTVLTQPQAQLGVAAGAIPNDALVRAAQNAFRQGEGFQTGEVRSIPGGVQIDWTGTLTIAGRTQPVGGVILSRQVKDSVLLVLIAATEAGGDRVLGATSALLNSLQAR